MNPVKGPSAASILVGFTLVISLTVAFYSLSNPGIRQFSPWSLLTPTRSLPDVGQPKPLNLSQPLVIYQLYHSTKCYPKLYNNTLYRGLSQAAGQRRPHSDDLDAPMMLPLLNDSYYQNLLCEGSGMLAVAAHVERIHPQRWIGFQSWRAEDKGRALQPAAEDAILTAIREEKHGDALYFWADGGDNFERILDFYGQCNVGHTYCTSAFARVFALTFDLDVGDGAPPVTPPMPEDGGAWAFMTYFVMTTESFVEYTRLFRDFFVAVDEMWFYTHRDANICILSSGGGADSQYWIDHCYCFLLERLINIWAYHSGRRMIFVDSNTGEMTEQHPTENRTAWSQYFSKPVLSHYLGEFEKRAVRLNNRNLVNRLQTF